MNNERISSLESDIASMKTDVGAIRANYATRDALVGVNDGLSTRLNDVKGEVGEVRHDLIDLKDHAARMDANVAVIMANYVTHDQLQKAINTLTWKMYGLATALSAVVFFIAKNVK